jgi:hypothetical protein
MTRNELSLAVAMAQSDEELETFIGENSSQRLIDLFNGFGLSDYNPVHITIRDLACLVRYECTMMNCELDNHALNEIAELGKTKFIIVGLGDDDVATMLTADVLPHWYSVLV